MSMCVNLFCGGAAIADEMNHSFQTRYKYNTRAYTQQYMRLLHASDGQSVKHTQQKYAHSS
jgi:hypothetical protein